MDNPRKILIIEDDPEIATLIGIHIEDLGWQLDRATDGNTGLESALAEEYDLIILDIMLPGLDGLGVCRRIREEKRYTPILMLTSRAEEIDRVLGLELGADDYMTKPFSMRELIARIKAILRRVQVGAANGDDTAGGDVLDFGTLRVDLGKRRVLLDGRAVELTVKEYDLLALFARHPGRAFSRHDLLGMVWGYQFDGYDHTVNSHINRLRAKIEQDPSRPRFIKTVWGHGYRFAELEELAE